MSFESTGVASSFTHASRRFRSDDSSSSSQWAS